MKLQFSARDSISSDLIRGVTHGQWSHVDAVTEDGRLLGARAAPVGNIPAGVHIRPFDYLPFSATKIITLPSLHDDDFWNFLLDQVGKPYDKSAYISGLINRNWRDADSWCCTELIARAMEVSGILPYHLAVTGCVAPTDLILVLSVLTEV